MNAQETELLSKSRLHSQVLNSGMTCKLSPAMFASVVAKFAELARTDGGPFRSQLGHCELRIRQAQGYAVFGLKCDQAPIGLAGLAWEPCARQVLWEKLTNIHNRMMRGLQPSSARSEMGSPAVLISLAPSFLSRAGPVRERLTLLTLWGAAFGVLDLQHKRNTNC
jgi:hypothetical protein